MVQNIDSKNSHNKLGQHSNAACRRFRQSCRSRYVSSAGGHRVPNAYQHAIAFLQCIPIVRCSSHELNKHVDNIIFFNLLAMVTESIIRVNRHY